MAEKFRRKIEGELAAGTYQGNERKQWNDLRTEYENKLLDAVEPGTRDCTLQALNRFEWIVKPRRLQAIKTQTIDDHIARRRRDSRESLWTEFQRIQEAAGIHLSCHEDHEHTARCHVYGFHDLRRGFGHPKTPT